MCFSCYLSRQLLLLPPLNGLSCNYWSNIPKCTKMICYIKKMLAYSSYLTLRKNSFIYAGCLLSLSVVFIFTEHPFWRKSQISIEAKPAEEDEEGCSYLCDYKDDDVVDD